MGENPYLTCTVDRASLLSYMQNCLQTDIVDSSARSKSLTIFSPLLATLTTRVWFDNRYVEYRTFRHNKQTICINPVVTHLMSLDETGCFKHNFSLPRYMYYRVPSLSKQGIMSLLISFHVTEEINVINFMVKLITTYYSCQNVRFFIV